MIPDEWNVETATTERGLLFDRTTLLSLQHHALKVSQRRLNGLLLGHLLLLLLLLQLKLELGFLRTEQVVTSVCTAINQSTIQ